MSGLTPAERRGASLLVLILLVGAGHDVWRAHRARVPSSWTGPPPQPFAAGAFSKEAAGRSGQMPDSIPAPAPSGPRLDLNAATAADLDRLPGIGPVLAARIVGRREAFGPFRRLEDLLDVQGIGPRLLERLRARVTVHSAQPARTHLADSASVPKSTSR